MESFISENQALIVTTMFLIIVVNTIAISISMQRIETLSATVSQFLQFERFIFDAIKEDINKKKVEEESLKHQKKQSPYEMPRNSGSSSPITN